MLLLQVELLGLQILFFFVQGLLHLVETVQPVSQQVFIPHAVLQDEGVLGLLGLILLEQNLFVLTKTLPTFSSSVMLAFLWSIASR